MLFLLRSLYVFFLIFRCHFSHFTSTKHLLPILIGTVEQPTITRTPLVLFISSQALIIQYTLVTAQYIGSNRNNQCVSTVFFRQYFSMKQKIHILTFILRLFFHFMVLIPVQFIFPSHSLYMNDIYIE